MATRNVTSAINLPKLQVVGALRLSTRLTASVVLPKLQVSAELLNNTPKGVTAAIALPMLQVTGALRLGTRLTASVVLPKLQVSAALLNNRPKGVTAAITLPMLQVTGALRVRHFARCELVYSVAMQVPPVALGLMYWTLACDLRGKCGSVWSLSMPMAWQGQIVYEGPRRLVALEVGYGVRLALLKRLVWRLPLITEWALSYGSRTGLEWLTSWGSAPVVRSKLGVSWGSAPVVRSKLGVAWGASGWARWIQSVVYSVSTVLERSVLRVSAPLDDRVMVRVAWRAGWSMSDWSAESGRVVPVPEVALAATGGPVQVVGGVSIAQDVRDGLWRLRTVVNRSLVPGEAVILSVGVDEWCLVVTDGGMDRADVDALSYTVSAVSAPGVWDSTPVGELVGREGWHTGLASALAQALVGPLALEWQLADAQMPAPLVHDELWGLSRWAAIQRLARAFGGWALVSADGGAVTCRAFGALDHGVRVPLEAVWRREVTAGVLVSNRELADMILDDTDTQSSDPSIKRLVVRPVPWREVSLAATEPAVLTEYGVGEVVLSETMELVYGVGRLSRPADEVVSAQVWPVSAGPLRWRVDEVGVWLDAPVHATAQVRYVSRGIHVSVFSAELSPTLLTVKDLL